MEGGKTRIYKQNLSRLIRLTDFFGITDSSGLTPLSRIWDNGIINNGRRDESQRKPSIRERLEAAKKECAQQKPPEGKRTGRDTPERSEP